jgi:hypothetical protein
VGLKIYRFEHPKTERSITVGGWSYIWAGFLGAGYVWWIGYGSILQAVAINLSLGIGVIAIVLGTSILPSLQQLFVILVVCPLAVLLQGSLMISVIRNGFRKRGWLIRIA